MTTTSMNEVVQFFTDAATMAIVDPQVLEHRQGKEGEDEDWWRIDIEAFPEAGAGDIAIVGLGGDGV